MSTLKRYNGTNWEYVGGASTTDRFFYHIGDAPSNFDDAKTYGTYRVAGTYTNAPSSSSIWGILIVYESRGQTWIPSDASSWIWQEFRDTSGRIWRRYGVNTSTYTSWEFIGNDSLCANYEHRIGTWQDGKPLYSRWYKTTLTNTGLTNIQNITRNNYGVIWVNSYFTQNSLGSIMDGHYYYDSTDYQRMWIEGGNYIAFQGGSSFPRMPATLWYELRYTKSSD